MIGNATGTVVVQLDREKVESVLIKALFEVR